MSAISVLFSIIWCNDVLLTGRLDNYLFTLEIPCANLYLENVTQRTNCLNRHIVRENERYIFKFGSMLASGNFVLDI